MNIIDTKALLQSLDSLHQERDAAALAFESKGSFEMAYVARWSVVEAMVKRVVHAELCASLRLQLDEWREYLDEPGTTAPKVIRQFPIEVSKAKLPTANDLREKFSKSSNLLELLDPIKKYRKKRNAIAHSADAFAQMSKYEEYKAKVAAATEELRQMLSKTRSRETDRIDA